jgi:hypothetical protein
MYKTIRLFALIMAAATLAASVQGVAQTRSVLVNREALRCMLGQLDRIPARPRGVFVDIEQCTSEGLRIVRNAITPLQPADTSGVESVLFLRPDDLNCLRRHRRQILLIISRRSRHAYRLNFSPCRT